MKRLLLVLAAALLPFAAAAADKHPQGVDQECAECHADEEQAWLGGKHGLMNVKCVVCHGAPEVNFAVQPGPGRCQGCHADQVADLKGLPAKERSCFLCHENHTAAAKAGARAGFHGEGGAR